MINKSISAVRLKNAGANFGTVQAVVPANLEVAVGESVALLGSSGAGKTTMLRLMGGEVHPTSGVVEIGMKLSVDLRPGRELSSLVGMVHQQFDLVPNLSALQNTLAGNLGRWGLAKSVASLVFPIGRSAAMDALQRVGIERLAEHRVSRLSGGEQQRVAIARVLVQDPDIVLADEPVASVDPARAESILDMLKTRLTDRNGTLVASMHSVSLARAYFPRIVGLRNGAIHFDLPSRDVTDAMLEDLYRIEGSAVES